MTYDPEMKRHVLGLFATGHRHEAMSDALRCAYCSVKFAKAQGEFNRLSRMYPEKFVRVEREAPDREIENMGDQITERIRDDKLYKEHLRLLAEGTPEEKAREMKRFYSGYYKKYAGDNPKKLIL